MLAKVYHLVVQISVIPIEFNEISFTFSFYTLNKRINLAKLCSFGAKCFRHQYKGQI